MAVYAAYRHVELDNVGYGKKRVLKPPGGGSSDIFGATEAPAVQSSPRRAPRPQMQSSLFGASAEQAADTPARNKPGNDSYNRLFGPVDPRPPSATKNRLKSNIILNSEESPENKYNANSPVKSEANSQDGNPVTGEGYAVVNGEKEPSPPSSANNNPAPATNGTAHSAPPQRNRVPPGGYSSGLW